MKSKIISFQILRAISIFMIFLSHCEHLLNIDDSNLLKYFGAAGVSLFISLSGFLAASKYDDIKSEVSAFDLYKKRWQQFYKNHFLTLMISIPFTISILKNNPLQWFFQLCANGTLIHSMIPIQSVYFSFNMVSWYLSLMLVFALLTPLAIKVWKTITKKGVLILSVVTLAFELLLVLAFNNHGYLHWLVYIFPMTRFLDFLVGGGYYKIAKEIKEKQLFNHNRVLLCVGVIIECVLLVWSCFSGNNYFLTAVWTIPSTLIVTALFNIKNKNETNVVSRSLLLFGSISFEFFLVHQLVIRYLTYLIGRISLPYIFGYILSFAIAFVGAYVLHNCTLMKAKRE